MISSTWSKRVPCSSAICELAWMTVPSASGSLNGTPTSMMSAPAASSPCSSATLRARSGCPAVTYGTNARRPLTRSAANRFAMASEEIVANPDAIALGILRLDDRAEVQAIRALVREVHERSGGLEVALRVADHAHDRS